MLAAVDAPSRTRVTPRTTRLPVIGARMTASGGGRPRSAVNPVMITATAPKIGP